MGDKENYDQNLYKQSIIDVKLEEFIKNLKDKDFTEIVKEAQKFQVKNKE